MMIQQHKFVEKNIDMLRKLTRNGYVSPTLLVYYNIYKSYMTTKDKSKIVRYKTVATETSSSVTTVRRAVADMKKYIKE